MGKYNFNTHLPQRKRATPYTKSLFKFQVLAVCLEYLWFVFAGHTKGFLLIINHSLWLGLWIANCKTHSHTTWPAARQRKRIIKTAIVCEYLTSIPGSTIKSMWWQIFIPLYRQTKILHGISSDNRKQMLYIFFVYWKGAAQNVISMQTFIFWPITSIDMEYLWLWSEFR